MPRPSTLLAPTPGFSPMVGGLVAMLGYTRETTLAAVDGLTSNGLTHRHDVRVNSIGALLAHAISGHDLAWHQERLASVRARMLTGLRSIDDAWLAECFDLPWLGRETAASNGE